jgi:hypothetical protein
VRNRSILATLRRGQRQDLRRDIVIRPIWTHSGQ